ncbi:MAG: FAD-binding oxidoreductase [Bacteroidota bacterium]
MKQRIVILGGGLAASFIAARCALRGHEVTIIDDQHPNSASRVAAGLFNIITGRFGALSWLGPQLLEEIQAFFSQPTFSELQSYLHYTPIYRPFKTIEGYNKWIGRSVDPVFQEIVQFYEQPQQPHLLHNERGGIMIQPCGWADTSRLLQGFEEVLTRDFDVRYIKREIPYTAFDLEKKSIILEKEPYAFDHVIFAEGYRMTHNPWLKDVRIIPNKGEILLLHAPSWKLPFVLSRKVYLVHIGDDRYVCGSTYRNQFDTTEPTEEGKAEILSHLAKAIKKPFDLVGHWAGVRPTTPNRRPIVGSLPTHQHVHVLGGFGTKGMLLAPFTSRLLDQLIFEGIDEIPEEAHIDRFFS